MFGACFDWFGGLLDYVKARVVEDAENRRALHARFLHAQTFAQHDPWAAQNENTTFKTLVPAE